jgi:hypothetical protein
MKIMQNSTHTLTPSHPTFTATAELTGIVQPAPENRYHPVDTNAPDVSHKDPPE